MNIMIDGYNLGLEHGTGVATYARTLSSSAASLGHDVSILYGLDRRSRYDGAFNEVFFFDGATREKKWGASYKAAARHIASRYWPIIPDEIHLKGTVVLDAMPRKMPTHSKLWNASRLYGSARDSFKATGRFTAVKTPHPVDIAHFTYPLPVKVSGAKNIYTLHDLVPLRLPYTTLDDKKYYVRLCKEIVKNADHIVTVSEASRRDIIDILGVAPERVTNTYQCSQIPAELANRPDNEIGEELQGIFGLERRKYFLFFGAIEPKKNVGRLIEAYLGSGVDTPLVIVGAPGWSADPELRLLKSLGALSGTRENSHPRIIRLEYLPLRLLVTLIRGAKATLFPSLYEGFGLPALESMHLGTPVLTSNTSAMPEIVGDAALQIDPFDVADVSHGIRELDGNDELRLRLSAAGVKQAERFSQIRYEKRLSELYERLTTSRARKGIAT